MTNAAYGNGKQAALASFGLRTAADIGRMPDGPHHIGASQFAKAVEGFDPPPSIAPVKANRLDRQTVWGQPASVESGGLANSDPALASQAV